MTKAVPSYRYETKRSDEPLRTRLNNKRVHRVYRGAGLMIRRKKRKHCVRVGQPLRVWTATNQKWTIWRKIWDIVVAEPFAQHFPAPLRYEAARLCLTVRV